MTFLKKTERSEYPKGNKRKTASFSAEDNWDMEEGILMSQPDLMGVYYKEDNISDLDTVLSWKQRNPDYGYVLFYNSSSKKIIF